MFQTQGKDSTEARLSQAMEAYFKGDTKRINHALRVTEYAKELLKKEGETR